MSISSQEARKIVRKSVKRVAEGEAITHLNIMPMMDIMTILLVAFIFQVSTGAEALTAGAVQLPRSSSQEPVPSEATVVIVSQTAVVVEGKQIVSVRNGDVDEKNKKGGKFGIQIVPLSKFLGALRHEHERELKAKGKPVPAIPELMIVADKLTPYRLLLSVMYSAKVEQAGYKRFRLITLQGSSSPDAKK